MKRFYLIVGCIIIIIIIIIIIRDKRCS